MGNPPYIRTTLRNFAHSNFKMFTVKRLFIASSAIAGIAALYLFKDRIGTYLQENLLVSYKIILEGNFRVELPVPQALRIS